MQRRAVTFGIATAIVWWLLLTLLLLNMWDAQAGIALLLAPVQGLFVGLLASLVAYAQNGLKIRSTKVLVWLAAGLLFLTYLAWLVSEVWQWM
jgi:hypothetical protein